MTEKKTFQEKELELLRESVDYIEKTEKKKTSIIPQYNKNY